MRIFALIGTALTPAFPISGFSFLPFGKKRFISLTNKIPLADAMMKARAPRAKILMVFNVRNSEAWVEQPTVRPRRITTISFKLLLAVLASRVVFPLSFRRFPKNSIPSKGKPDGTMKVVRSRVEWKVSIAYGSDIDKARKVILGILADDERIIHEPDANICPVATAPFVAVSELGGSDVVLVVRAWVDNSVYWDVRGK